MQEKLNIVFLDSHTLIGGGDMDLESLKRFGELLSYDVTYPSQVVGRCRKADIVISNKVVLDEEKLKQLPNLKYIIVAATGYDNIDIKAAKSLGIPVSNVVGYSSSSVAQHVFAMLLAYLNQSQRYFLESKDGEWSSQEHFSYQKHTIYELKGKVIGIIGMGKIGQSVARIALGFGMKVATVQRQSKKETIAGVEYMSLEKLLATSDIISLHVPLNDSTFQLVNKESLSLMKNSAVLINTARGDLINENDLREALDGGEIHAALLDVLTKEPPPQNHVLLDCANCFITPHQAWASFEARERLLEGVVNNIEAYQYGKPINLVG